MNRTWLDRLLRREDQTVNPADVRLLEKHKRTLETVDEVVVDSHIRIANAINETGAAIRKTRRAHGAHR